MNNLFCPHELGTIIIGIIAEFIVFNLLYTRKEQPSNFVCILCVDLNRIFALYIYSCNCEIFRKQLHKHLSECWIEIENKKYTFWQWVPTTCCQGNFTAAWNSLPLLRINQRSKMLLAGHIRQIKRIGRLRKMGHSFRNMCDMHIHLFSRLITALVFKSVWRC